MKALISILSVLSILLLVGCSTLEQESSPVAPEFNKLGSGTVTQEGTYSYLQCFNFVPVKSFSSTKSPGSVEVVIPLDKFPKVFMHMFAVLEYEDFKAPIKNNMIFIGKPLNNVFDLEGIQTNNLKNIKIYYYTPGNNGHGISPPYEYMTSFSELKINDWRDTGGELIIESDDWNTNISDTFIELEFGDLDSGNNVLTYIAKPSEQKISIPKFSKELITGLKVYALYDNLRVN